MRLEYINPFVDSAMDILRTTVTNEINKGELTLRSNIKPMLGLVLIVGITGQATGRVLIDMTQDLGLKIASIMNNEEIKNFDELANSTLTELANMIVAAAATKLHSSGYTFDITPPAIFIGDNLRISDNKIESLIVPLELLNSKLEINVALKEV
ncbi:MAG: chemotaxis protein CheX [Spirochaetes bacterium]|nr:chemotaxis protein CheX [Spirochaetota bacterium]